MTTIVGIQKDGYVILGADTQVTDGARKHNHVKMEKISKNNGYLIAGAGDSQPCDILQHVFIPPLPTIADRKDLYHFMITTFIPAMRECLEENKYEPSKEDKDSGFNTLIVFDGEIFDIGDDFSVVLNNDGIYGIGAGSAYAIGALYAGATVEKALEISASNDIYTSGPFQIVKQLKSTKVAK
jgi:ATP-dependent protease HslVU (ClpYQ) peptidase subunit